MKFNGSEDYLHLRNIYPQARPQSGAKPLVPNSIALLQKD